MFSVVRFEAQHLDCMRGQSMNPNLENWIQEGHAAHMEIEPHAFTGMWDGVPALCGGVVVMWHNRGCLWSFFNQDFKGNFVPVFRNLRKFLDKVPVRRLEVAIEYGVPNARRRAEMLGFTLETEHAPSYFPDGSPAALYARVRD
jgi:hypothetical protein